MSMVFGFAVPGLAVLAAERRWTRLPDHHSFEGPPKLLQVHGGFAAAVGDAASSVALLASLQGADEVTPQLVTARAKAAHMLFGAEFKVTALLRTVEGPQLMSIEQPKGSGVMLGAGFCCGIPFDPRGDYAGIEELAKAAAADCRSLAVYDRGDGRSVLAMPPVVARIARLFREAAERSSFVGTTLDVGVFYGARHFYLNGSVEQLEDELGAQRACLTSPGSYRLDLTESARPSHVAYVGPLVEQVWITRARFEQGVPTPADPYSYAEDNALDLSVVTSFTTDAHGNRYFDVVLTRPPEGEVDYVNARPYYVRPNGQYAWGYARTVDILPLIEMQPIVDSDDHETTDKGYFFVSAQNRGMPLTSVTMGRQTSPSNIAQGLTPTRGPGDTSVVKSRTMVAGEYEGEITLPIGWQSWIWFDLVFANNYRMRVMSPALGPNRAPSFAGTVPLVVGTTIWVHGDNVRSVKVERKSGGTWEVDRDSTLPLGVDVALQDDSGNPGLSSGTAAYLVTIYSDPISQRDGNTITDSQSVNVTAAGGSATYSLDIMTVSAPSIGDTVGHVTYKASSSTPAIDTRRRYRVGGGPFGSWAAVAAASPDPAPTTSTQYPISGLPTARAITGEIDPPQFTVEVEVEGTLLAGGTEHDVQVRSFSYTTNADDV